jgi:transcriptional regulator with XRE-family HTH domain
MDMFKNLGLTLAVIRTMRGLNQADLARAAGVGKSQLSKYESGKELPKLDSLEKLLAVLKVSAGDFFFALGSLDEKEALFTRGGDRVPAPLGMSLLANDNENALFPLFKQLFNLYASLAGEKIRLELERHKPR